MRIVSRESATLVSSDPRRPLEVVRIGHELFSSYIVLGSGLARAKSRGHETQAPQKAADAKFIEKNSDANEVVELCKW